MDRDTRVNLPVTETDLVLMINAINEVLHGIDVPEFATRLGSSDEEARGLLKRLQNLLDEQFPQTP